MKKIKLILFIGLILSAKNLFSQDFELYVLRSNGFISLTDRYEFSDDEKSSVLSEKYLDEKADSIYYHKLSPKNRQIFLGRLNISNDDKLFLYNYVLDTLITYQVENLKLIAKLNPYGSISEIPPPHTYMIGFDLNKKYPKNWSNPYDRTYVYIGNENPFKLGGLKPMKWDKINERNFPFETKYKNLKKWFKEFTRGQSYKFESNGLEYYLQNLKLEGSLTARQLVVIKSKTDSIIFNKVYFNSESRSLNRITLTDKKDENIPNQWTGELFKNRPSIIFGFLYHSFGCPRIDFISKEENSITILCDNRH